MTTSASAMVEERNQKGDSDSGSKNVGSFVKINSISIDLADDSNKNHSSAKCDHFSIRGYVSEVRKKNWKLCWPFPLDDEKNNDEEDESSLLPPLTSPKFRWWSCQSCQQEIGTKEAEKGLVSRSNDSGTVSKSKSDYPHIPSTSIEATHQPDVHQASKTNSVDKRQSDVNTSAHVNTKHQDKKPMAYRGTITSLTGPSSGTSTELPRPLDINLNVTEDKPECDTVTESRKLDEARPLVPFKHSGGKQKVTDSDLATPAGVCKHSTKIRIEDQNLNSADSQLHRLLQVDSGGSSILASSNIGASESAKRSSNGHVSGLLLDECDKPSSNSTEIVRSNNIRDHNQSSSTGPLRRKTRKVRLLTDLLFDNGSTKTDQVIGKDGSPPSNSVHSASTGTVNISVPQSQVSLPDNHNHNRREDLDESKKRKSPLDEELRSPEMRSAINLNKKTKSFKESEGTSDGRTYSETKGGSSTGLYVESGNRTHWSKFRSDNIIVTDNKKKKKKIQTDDVRPHILNIEDQVGISSKVNVGDSGISFRAVKETSSSRGVEKIPMGIPRKEKKQSSFSKGKSKMPQVDEMLPSKYPTSRTGLLKKVPITRNEDILRTASSGPTNLSFRQVEDSPMDMGLQLSLGGSPTPKKCSRKYTPEVGDIGVSKFYWQENTPIDETMMNGVERNYISESTVPSKSSSYGFFKKRVHGDVGGGQLITYSSPVLNDKQNSNSHGEERRRSLGKQVVDTSGSRNSQKTIKAKEHSALPRKRILEIADRVSDKVTVDDIPMDIVELMARNQYERGQQNPENNRALPRPSPSEGRITPMMDYDRRAYTTDKLRISEETSNNNNKQANSQPRSARNGMTSSRKNPKPTRQKPVDYYPNLNGDHSNRTQLPPKKSPSLVPIGSASPTACSCAQNCHWNSNILSRDFFNSGIQRESCDTCPTTTPTPPRPMEEPAQIWASALPLERPVRYQNSSAPPQRSNLQLASSSHSLPQKSDFFNRENELKFSKHGSTSLDISETFGRRNSEYQYVGGSSSRHNGVEPQQNNLRGSLDLYSNETIPAMHLLSLMTAGTGFNTSGNPRLAERDFPPENNNRTPKNYPQMQIGVYNNNNNTNKPREAVKHPLDYHGRSQLPVKSHNFFPVNPIPGPSTSSFLHETSFERGSDFADQVSFGSRGKEKVQRSSGGPSQSRGRKPLNPSFSSGGFAVPNHSSIPSHDARKGFLVPSSSMAPPFQPRASEYPTDLKLGTPHGTEASRPLKTQPVTLTCSVNRNPADFSSPEAGNEYMISGEDLKVVKRRKRRALSIPGQSKRQRTAKRATDNEQA